MSARFQSVATASTVVLILVVLLIVVPRAGPAQPPKAAGPGDGSQRGGAPRSLSAAKGGVGAGKVLHVRRLRSIDRALRAVRRPCARTTHGDRSAHPAAPSARRR